MSSVEQNLKNLHLVFLGKTISVQGKSNFLLTHLNSIMTSKLDCRFFSGPPLSPSSDLYDLVWKPKKARRVKQPAVPGQLIEVLQQIQQPKSESKDKRLLCSKTSWGVEDKECKVVIVHFLRHHMFAQEF